VADTVRKHQYAIEILRRQIKQAKPRPVPKNLITGKATLDCTTQIKGSLDESVTTVATLGVRLGLSQRRCSAIIE